MDETTVAAEGKGQVKTFGRNRLLPGAYTVDLSTVCDAPVKVNGEPCGFVEAYSKLRDSKIEEMPESFSVISEKYVTGEGVILFECEWPLRATMRKLIELTRQGIDPHSVTWFYYDHDWSRDADERYIFFAVRDGKIIKESCNFHSDEPLILKRKNPDDEPIWHSHPSFDEAWERYCYRRFYSETVTGQLMVLRPDEPILYHYERPQSRDIVGALQLITLLKVYRLLWLAILFLISAAFPLLRNYLAIAAGAFGIEFLWFCRRTRQHAVDVKLG